MVGGLPQRGEGQSVLTGPGAREYIITNLMKDTNYQVELFGFTPIHPHVFSSVATVSFTTTGVCRYMHVMCPLTLIDIVGVNQTYSAMCASFLALVLFM